MEEGTLSHPEVPPPGFGLLRHQQVMTNLFPSALDTYLVGCLNRASFLPLTIRELSMLDFINKVTDEKDWATKVFDVKIANQWKSGVVNNSDLDFTQKMADYCIDELKYKARILKVTGCISIYNGDVIKSDTAITPESQSLLKATVAPLENVPEHQKDWSPGSNGQVLDLVHPSLFPLVCGVSRVLKDDYVGLHDFVTRCGGGEVVEKHRECQFGDDGKSSYHYLLQQSNPYSDKFQWIPCDIDISGANPKIVSYINNLHPKHHQKLYSTIERILAAVIPVWNLTLTALKRWTFSRRIEYPKVKYDQEALDRYMEIHGPKRVENESDFDYGCRQSEWKWDHWSDYLIKPDPVSFSFPNLPLPGVDVDLRRDYGKGGLQVIVKLTNIHLTPENPKFNGCTWHVEGQQNEQICAAAIYCYDCDNITSSRLAFRQLIDLCDIENRRKYPGNHTWWLERIFGLEDQGGSIQDLGGIELREGRLVTFPNILLTQLQPMELADPTRPGHHKILTLFLVDPNVKIISTANVPCQRRDWWEDLRASELSQGDKFSAGSGYHTLQNVEDFPLTLDRAKKLRVELMSERRKFVLAYNRNICRHENTIDLGDGSY